MVFAGSFPLDGKINLTTFEFAHACPNAGAAKAANDTASETLAKYDKKLRRRLATDFWGASMAWKNNVDAYYARYDRYKRDGSAVDQFRRNPAEQAIK
jgi:hypothetical protein